MSHKAELIKHWWKHKKYFDFNIGIFSPVIFEGHPSHSSLTFALEWPSALFMSIWMSYFPPLPTRLPYKARVEPESQDLFRLRTFLPYECTTCSHGTSTLRQAFIRICLNLVHMHMLQINVRLGWITSNHSSNLASRRSPFFVVRSECLEGDKKKVNSQKV